MVTEEVANHQKSNLIPLKVTWEVDEEMAEYTMISTAMKLAELGRSEKVGEGD